MGTLSATTNEKPRSVVDAKLKPSAELQILIGGPYHLNGEEHRYGHTAIRVKTQSKDLTYDFGRYGRTTGDFGAEGEGILRVWSSFRPYIAIETSLGRKTIGFVYSIFDYQANSIFEHYERIIRAGKHRPELEKGRSALRVFQLQFKYHALQYNCTTFSLDGVKAVFSDFESGAEKFIKPDTVLTLTERIAMKAVGGGTPSRLFLPANLQDYLTRWPSVKSTRIDHYGGSL